MTTFSLILKNLLKLQNNIFSINYKMDNIDGIIKFLFYPLFYGEYSIKNKFLFYKKTIENFLLKNNQEKKILFLDYFYKIQKIYLILNRFIYNYKYKKAKIVVNNDFCLNLLNIDDKNIICIFHNNSKYLFHISELIKIIETALTNTSYFFAKPKSIKNPYDNIPFTKSILYNIYFFIKYKTNYFSDFFNKFYEVDFNLNIFKFRNEYILRDYCIKNYVYKSSSNIILNEIKQCLNNFNYSNKMNKINIDEDFPKDKLIKIMQPYLLLYIMSQYSFLVSQQKEANYFLNNSLEKFAKFNPNFGRKQIKIITNIKNNFNLNNKMNIEKKIEFNDIHIKFNNNEKYNNNFLINHLIFEEENTNQLLITRNYNYLNYISHDDRVEDESEDEDSDDEEGGDEIRNIIIINHQNAFDINDDYSVPNNNEDDDDEDNDEDLYDNAQGVEAEEGSSESSGAEECEPEDIDSIS